MNQKPNLVRNDLHTKLTPAPRVVRAKLYPIEKAVNSFRCGSKRCVVCKYITETDTFFTRSVTGET